MKVKTQFARTILVGLMFWAQIAKPSDMSYEVGLGKNERLCKALASRINEHNSPQSNDAKCSLWAIVSSFPEFSEPDWQDLDLNDQKNKELFFKLLKANFGSDAKRSENADRELEKNLRMQVDIFVGAGGKLRVWRAKQPLIFAKSGQPRLNQGPQTFVQQGFDPQKSTSCTGTPHSAWDGNTSIAKSDLTGIDSAIDPNDANSNKSDFALLKNGSFLLFEGKPYLVVSGGQEIYRPSMGTLEQLCTFDLS